MMLRESQLNEMEDYYLLLFAYPNLYIGTSD